MENFKQAYNKLNPAQKKAVDQIDGAVLVIAGPGTGKTQLLSLRVANILDMSDSLPENILCLTFTNKAANNMQLRLSQLTGAAGKRVMIKTFHSFAAEIMSMHPEHFWNGATLTNVPDAVQLEIITDILSGLPLDNPLALKFAGQFTAVKDVRGALKLAKEAGLTPDKLRALITLNFQYIDEIEAELADICSERLNYKKLDELAMRLDQLPKQDTDELTRPLQALSTVLVSSFETAHSADEGTGRTRNLSGWKTRWVQSVDGTRGMFEERKRNKWWLHLADIYEAYRDTLHSRGYYDYADMIIEVITQLEQNPDMRADLQERFQYVLIDEFQDTNAAQLRLAHLVADHYTQEGNPNIMAVGDDDQSIYKFNGAELSNMRNFRRSYPEAKEYVLTENYRSSQDILDFSRQVIEQAGERVTLDDTTVTKTLIARNPPEKPGTIGHICYPTKEHEYYGLAKRIKELKKRPGSIAVLARGHETLMALAQTLHALGVPVRYEHQQDVLSQPMIVEISYICEIISALSKGDEPVVNKYLPLLLSYPAWQIEPLDLWRLALRNRREPHWIESLLEDKRAEVANIGHWLLWLGRETANQPLSRMLEFIIGLRASEYLTSPLRRYYLEADDIDTPYLSNISAVRKLIGLAQEFSRQNDASVDDFVRLLSVSKNNNDTLTDESLFVTSGDAVELLTVHKAKGLEFDSVIVADAMEQIWKPSSRGRKPPSNLPLRPAGDDIDDYVRLMFVAVTRARRNVLIGSYFTNEAGETAMPSAIIRDILPAVEISFAEADNPVKVLETALRWPRLEGSQEKELLHDILKDYTLNPSAFLDFLDVKKGGPHYFLEKHLLKLPEAQSTMAAFGSAVHEALEAAQHIAAEGGFEIKRVLAAYEAALTKQSLGQSDYDRYLTHGRQVISRLFENYGMRLEPDGRAETSLTAHLSEVTLAGKLDRIVYDPQANRLLITDYKTGKPLSSFQTRSKALQLKAWRHRGQLQLYALMVRESGLYRSSPNIDAQMMYVEADTAKELIRTYSPGTEELDRLEKLVTAVWHKITTLNLPDTRHYSEDYAGVLAFEEDLLSDAI